MKPRAARQAYLTAEALPPAGLIAAFSLRQPHDHGALPTSSFARSVAAADISPGYSAFVVAAARRSAPPMLARLPAARPAPDRPSMAGPTPASSAVLAYAPASPGIEAPFDAVLGGGTVATQGNDGRPRPRPDPTPLLTWLDGRALGQFAPGQHAWVQNPLPASAFTAKEQKCLAEGIYFEARGESELGQAAVAQVILNRVRNPTYPKTICGVVYQNKHWRNRCQFSFACDGRKDRIHSPPSYRIAERVGKDVTEGRIWLESVGDSTHYYAQYVSPRWARRMNKMEQIGAHLFYRTLRGGWS